MIRLPGIRNELDILCRIDPVRMLEAGLEHFPRLRLILQAQVAPYRLQPRRCGLLLVTYTLTRRDVNRIARLTRSADVSIDVREELATIGTEEGTPIADVLSRRQARVGIGEVDPQHSFDCVPLVPCESFFEVPRRLPLDRLLAPTAHAATIERIRHNAVWIAMAGYLLAYSLLKLTKQHRRYCTWAPGPTWAPVPINF